MDERDLKALATLQAVARCGGFAAAARELGSTRAAVSRVIAEAEQRVGVRLCHRTTRRVVLTDAALELLRDAGGHLEALHAAWSRLPDREGSFRGLIRVSCSHALGRAFLLPAVQRYREQHPEVRFELRLADTNDDLVARSLDLALRVGPLPDSSMVARTLGRLRVVLVASADAARVWPRLPRALDEASALPSVAFHVPGSGQRRPWTLGTGREQTLHEPGQAVVQVDSVEGVVDLVRAGVGIGLAPRYLVEADLAAGRLVSLLPQAPFIGPEVHLCYAHRDLVPLRTRAFSSLLVEGLKPALG